MKLTNRFKRGLFAVIFLGVLFGGIWGYPKLKELANVGGGFVAHQVCSCVFVSKRDLQACIPDIYTSMKYIDSEQISINGVEGVRANLPMFPPRTALHHPGYGCILEKSGEID